MFILNFLLYSALTLAQVDIPGGDKCIEKGPCAGTVTIDVPANNPKVILLSSLSVNLDGTEFLYFELIERPKHGTVSLDLFGMHPYGEWTRDLSKNNIPKFEPYLQLKYMPDNQFIGDDTLTFYAHDKKGRKSNLGSVTFKVSTKPEAPISVYPKVFNLEVNTTARESFRVDLMALTFHPTGEVVRFPLETKEKDATLRQTDHGVVDGYFNYASKEGGSEEIVFQVFAPTAPNLVSKGKVKINIADRNIRSRIGGYRDFLNTLYPSEQKGEFFFLFLLLSTVISVSWLVFNWISYISNSTTNQIFSVGLGLTALVFGSHVISRANHYAISGTIFLGLLPGLFSTLLPKAFRKVTDLIAKFLNGYGVIFVVLVILNSLAWFYQLRNIKFPEMTIDGQDYLALYYNFKFGVLGYVDQFHSERILTPFLAALLPGSDPVTSFKIVNLVFFNLAFICMCYLWRFLKIKTYLIILASAWMFLHQFAFLKFGVFWGTNVDAGSLFFASLVAIALAKQKPWWLLIIAPIAVIQRNNFSIIFPALIVWEAFKNFTEGKSIKDIAKIVAPYVIAVALCKITLVLPLMVTPTRPEQFSSLMLLYALVVIKILEGDPLLIMRSFVMLFGDYGGFIITSIVIGFQGVKKLGKSAGLFWVANGISFILVLLLNTDREIFMIYPFLMTVFLLAINECHPVVPLTSIFLSIPILGLYIDFPFSKMAPMNSGAPITDISAWGVYWVFVTIMTFALYKNLPASWKQDYRANS